MGQACQCARGWQQVWARVWYAGTEQVERRVHIPPITKVATGLRKYTDKHSPLIGVPYPSAQRQMQKPVRGPQGSNRPLKLSGNAHGFTATRHHLLRTQATGLTSLSFSPQHQFHSRPFQLSDQKQTSGHHTRPELIVIIKLYGINRS